MIKLIPKITKAIERLAAKNFVFYRLVTRYYKALVKDEVNLANIQSRDRVLCIGGGPCPFSGILLHELTGAHVTIIDNDKHCIRTSRQVIEKLGYMDFIDVFLSDGSDISSKDYTVIHMAAQVSPMEQVFNNIKQGCSLGAKILVRVPKSALTRFYSIGDYFTLHKGYEKATHHWRNIDSTALYIKARGEYGI